MSKIFDISWANLICGFVNVFTLNLVSERFKYFSQMRILLSLLLLSLVPLFPGDLFCLIPNNIRGFNIFFLNLVISEFFGLRDTSFGLCELHRLFLIRLSDLGSYLCVQLVRCLSVC